MEAYDVLLSGGICCDVIFSNLKALPEYGTEIWAERLKVTVGGIFNTAAACARLGMKVALPCVLGTDLFSTLIRETMKRERVSTAFVREAGESFEQLSVVLNFGFERTFVSYAKDRSISFTEDHRRILQDSLARAYIVSPDPDPEVLDVMIQAKQNGTVLVMDCFTDEEVLRSEITRRQMQIADYFLPNAKEACMITRKQTPAEAMGRLKEMTCCPIIKNGDHGVLYNSDGEIRSLDAVHFGEAIDTTGAGDNFVAGFTYGLLHEYPLEKSLRCGLLCGGKSVTAIGGFENAIYKDELEKLL